MDTIIHESIKRPTFLVDKAICMANIQRMAEKAERHNLRFRPHFKTHQSAKIGEWFRDAGINAITVSSVEMATYFFEYGWDDITIAFPVNLREIAEIRSLSDKIKINLLVENEEGAKLLAKEIESPVGVYFKIDTGHHRTGIDYFDTEVIDRLIGIISQNKKLFFKGFLTHTGNTYNACGIPEIKTVIRDSILKIRKLKERYERLFPKIEISIGDTPSCSVNDQFSGVDEIRPGNFVFYDLMMLNLGVCSPEDIAVELLCPVVAHHTGRSEIVIYGGAIHLSKDVLAQENGAKSYGRITVWIDGKREILDERNYVSAISQEHGVLKIAPEWFRYLPVGALAGIIPVHSCLTAHQAPYYLTTEGEKIGTLNSKQRF